MRVGKIISKIAIYSFIILISCAIALMITEIILTKTHLGKERYKKKIDPEPYVATVNKQGFRVRSADVTYSKDSDGYFRIICLGDSFTYGHGVADDKTYPVFLEKYLEDICQRKIQVINAGVCGATITEELDMYIKHCIQLQPALVVLLFQEADINDFAKILLLKAKKGHVGDIDKYLLGSKIYSLVKLKILQQQKKYSISYYEKYEEYVMNKYLENVESLNKIVMSNNSVLIVVIYNGDENEALKSFCINKHIPVVDIRKEYAQRAAQGDIYLIYHHNEKGNDLLAKLIAQKLSEKISGNNNPQ
jgi:lysophospholipase L1-like esterase